MVKHNLGLRPTDLENIALIKAMYPNPATKTAAIRLALAAYIRNADPVQLEMARKQVRKASADPVQLEMARKQVRKASKEQTK